MPRLKSQIRKAKRKVRSAKRVNTQRQALGLEQAVPVPLMPEEPVQGPTAQIFRLTPKQVEARDMMRGLQRHTLLVGGSRSGKTFLLIRAVITRAISGANSRHVIFRMRGNACRQSVWLDTFVKVMRLCYPGVAYENHLMDGYTKFANGAEIWFAGLDDKERVEKILGMEFVTIYFCECSQIPYASVEIALTRLAQKIEGMRARAFYDLNPTTIKHWTAMLFLKGIDPSSRKPVKDFAQYKWMKLNPVDNVDNIDEDYIDSLQALSSRARKRFYEGEYLTEVDGALWTPEILERTRVDALPGDANRVVIAVDPSGAKGEEEPTGRKMGRSDEIGLSVCAKVQNEAFFLKDATLRASPETWGKRAVSLYEIWKADCIVAEQNYGGDMVRAVIHGVNPNVKVKLVTASRGKVVRAEPVSALFEQGKAHLVGSHVELEEELQAFTADKYMGDRSPNRADALVWGITELMLGETLDGTLSFYKDWNIALNAEKENQKVVNGVVMPSATFDPQEYLKHLKKLSKETAESVKPKRDPTRAW